MRIHVLDTKLVPHFDLKRDGNEYYWMPKEIYKVELIDNKPTTPYFKCGLCPTEISMTNENTLETLAERHIISHMPNRPWYGYLFSLWSAVIVLLICAAIVKIVTHTNF